MSAPLRNWAGNFDYSTPSLHEPDSIEEVQNLVRSLPSVHTLGSRHSFNALADSEAHLLSLRRLAAIVDLNREQGLVTVEGGITYGQLCPALEAEGFALANLASLPHISVAGACATATHGSGETVGNLATQVRAMEFVQADGELVRVGAEDEEFAGTVVHLGALGPVVRITLALEPSFQVAQTIYRDLPFQTAFNHFDSIQASGYSVSLFTDWSSPRFNQVWVKRRSAEAVPELFGAPAFAEPVHPVPGMATENCTEQLGRPGPWHQRLAHFRMEFTPSAGAELQSEFFVPRANAVSALDSLSSLAPEIAPLLFVTEVRTIAGDNLWLSPAHRGPQVGIHFTWRPDWPAVRALLPKIEASLAPFQPIPHWGKLFTMDGATVRSRYPRLPDFVRLAERFDPLGKFRNAFLKANLIA